MQLRLNAILVLLTCSYFGLNHLLLVRSKAVDQEKGRWELPPLGLNDDQMHITVGFTNRERAFCILIQVRNSLVIGISVGVAVGRRSTGNNVSGWTAIFNILFVFHSSSPSQQCLNEWLLESKNLFSKS